MAEIIVLILALVLVALYFLFLGVFIWIMTPLVWGIHLDRKSRKAGS